MAFVRRPQPGNCAFSETALRAEFESVFFQLIPSNCAYHLVLWRQKTCFQVRVRHVLGFEGSRFQYIQVSAQCMCENAYTQCSTLQCEFSNAQGAPSGRGFQKVKQCTRTHIIQNYFPKSFLPSFSICRGLNCAGLPFSQDEICCAQIQLSLCSYIFNHSVGTKVM